MSDNKRIAKNAMFLYIRMILIMGISLYTSRVVLDKLGIEDFGIYGAVGGIVGMLGFLNGTLSTGTSRFLTYELGAGNSSKLNIIFSTAFYAHLLLAIIVILILETGGLWFLYNKLIISESRLNAAEWVLHISVITAAISITQVPYTSIIIAHENMRIYAYIGLFEAFAKLIVVYLLTVVLTDKLILYAVLVALIQVVTIVAYRFFCIRQYEESKIKLLFDVKIFKNILSFSGWNLISSIAEMLGRQGLIVLINMFFAPAIVAAQTIANQLTQALLQFITNFRSAINPQIIKLYAAKQYDDSRKLTLSSSIYVFDLLLLLGLPAIVIMEPIMNFWLKQVPEYAVLFAQYSIVKAILDNWGAAFQTPLIASGELKYNSYACVIVTFSSFAFLYLLFASGGNIMWVQWIGLLCACLYSFIIKPIILYRRVGYPSKEIICCFYTSIKIAFIPIVVTIICLQYKAQELLDVIICAALPAISVVISSYINLDSATRKKIHQFVVTKIRKYNP